MIFCGIPKHYGVSFNKKKWENGKKFLVLHRQNLSFSRDKKYFAETGLKPSYWKIGWFQ